MAAKIRLTDKLVRDLEQPATGNRITYDTDLTGLGARVTAAGARSFILAYRFEGRERRMTLGTFLSADAKPSARPIWSVAAARKRVIEERRKIDRGIDPLAEREEKRDAATVRQLIRRFLDEHVAHLRPSTAAEYKGLLGIIDKEFGGQKVAAVHRASISKLHRARKRTPYRANRLLAVASVLFNFAVTEKLCPENPCRGIKRFPEDQRERYLSPDELARLTAVLNEYPAACAAKVDGGVEQMKVRAGAQKAVDVVRLCLLTGCRRGEAFSAQWSQLDFNRSVWVKPSAHTKQKRQHVAPLSDAAMMLLQGILDAAPKGEDGHPISPYVFPGRTAREPVGYIRDHWHAIRAAADLPDFRLHDARHTFASLLASSGASLPMVAALLGHTQLSATQRYVHLFHDPLKKAADEVGNVITGKPSAEVTPLRRDGVA